MSLIINILAAIGLFILIVYAIYYLKELINKKINGMKAMAQNPPSSYMQSSGIKCPDYWVNTGIDKNGNFICKNSFNIQTSNPTTGQYKGKCNPEAMTFTPIQPGYTWEGGNPNGLTSYTNDQKYTFLDTSSGTNAMTRCAWINNCGPTPNVQGIWQGVNELCNNPPTS